MPQRIELLQIESSIGSNINRYISINFPLFLPVFNIILCYILNIIARNNISSENIFRKNARFSTDGAFSNRKTVEDILSEYFNSNSKLIIVISKLGGSLFYTTRLCLCYAGPGSTNKRGRQTRARNKLSTSQRFHSFPRATIIICPSIFHSLPFARLTLRPVRLRREQKANRETGISAKPSLAFNMWRPCAIVRGRSAPDTSASWLTSMWKHYYSTIVADGYLKSRVSNTRFSLRPMKGDGFEERSSKFPSFAIFYRV